jgi:hypothetical protein
MMSRMSNGLLQLLCIICFAVALPAQTPKQTQVDASRYFCPDCEDQGFANAQQPSDAVLDGLLATKEVKDSDPDLQGLSREKLRSLFRVVPVRLGSGNEQDFLAQGQGKLTGADCYWFWIVRARDGRATVLLFTNGLSVTILRHTTNGYSDIRGNWATAAFTGMEVFRYDGHTYRLALKQVRETKP